jgi:formate hydrogenlyase subunit 4
VSGESFAIGVLNVGIALLLAPLFEGVMRKLKAAIHSRKGPPITQPYLDVLKLLGKQDLRTARGMLYGALPALALASTLVLSLLVPMAGRPPFGFAGDIIVVIYVATMMAVFVMLNAYASGSPYAAVGGAREMMMALATEPVLAIGLVVGALKSGSLSVGDIMQWNASHGPAISMVLAGGTIFLALQAQVGKLPFDIPEADQEIMGGPFIEQSGPRLALFKWAFMSRQLVLAFLLVQIFAPWPMLGNLGGDLVIGLAKVLVLLVLVALVDVVNPRLRVDQAMVYFTRVVFVALGALAFAVIGM